MFETCEAHETSLTLEACSCRMDILKQQVLPREPYSRTRLPELRPAGSCGPEVLQPFAINLCSVAKHKFRSFPRSHAAKDNAVKQRVSTETVVAVHATCDLPCCVKASNWAALAHDLSFCVHFRTTHAIMNDRCNYRNVEWLRCYLVSRNDVVIEFLSASRRTTRSVPRLARWICWPTTTLWIFRCFLRGLVMLLVAIHECLEWDTHVLCYVCTRFIILHHTTASVVLTVPDNFFSSSLVEAESERWLVLPHLARDIVAPPKFIGESLSIGIEYQTAYTTESFCCQELNFGIWIVWFHEPRRVHLHPLEIN